MESYKTVQEVSTKNENIYTFYCGDKHIDIKGTTINIIFNELSKMLKSELPSEALNYKVIEFVMNNYLEKIKVTKVSL